MVGVVEVSGGVARHGNLSGAMLSSSLAALVLLVTGAMYFRSTEKTFADVVQRD
jgi:hypothetical protein